jgi:dihydroorotase
MLYDMLIKGGRVIDPATGIDGPFDVAFNDGRVAAVDHSIPSESAARRIDATGRLVTPGLIDLHTHVFRGADYFGVDADSLAWRSGVTTWLDAGSAGGFRMPAFDEHVVRPATVRIKALINISYLGLAGLNYDEYCNPKALNVDVLSTVARDYPELVVGIKARIGKEGVCYPGLRPLRKALEAAETTGLPVMCHISESPPSVDRVLALLRPGDVVTHSYTGGGERLVDEQGRVRPAARRARDRGVRFDIGHGAGSFSFDSAEALSSQGFWPDSISTDLHQLSVAGPNLVEDQAYIGRVRGDGSPQLTLLTVMTKFVYLGWPLTEIIRAVTATPARMFGWTDVGTLRPGARADAAILELAPGERELFDIYGNVRRIDRGFVCHATIVGGRQMAPVDVPPPPPWIRLVDREGPGPAAPANARSQ